MSRWRSTGGKAGSHGIQGIGAGFVPAVLNTEIYDEVITVEDVAGLTNCPRIKLLGICAASSSALSMAPCIPKPALGEHQVRAVALHAPQPTS